MPGSLTSTQAPDEDLFGPDELPGVGQVVLGADNVS